MRTVLLLGAGKSSSRLIDYFLDHAQKENLQLIVADHAEEDARKKIHNHPAAQAVGFNLQSEQDLTRLVKQSDIVISLLPATMHFPVAIECLKQRKNLVTASYVSRQMADLNEDAEASGLLFLNECGLDPGIDHMSAMKIIDEVKKDGGKMLAFFSYTGGLVAPESNDNPWGYKFSWNPKNVILAGQGTARFIENGKYKYIPYNRLFTDIEKISVEGYGEFDGYANRDSLSYRKIYQLENIPTLIRGTLRQSGFCNAWNVFVKLGLTDDTYEIDDSENLTYADLIEAFLPKTGKKKNLLDRLSDFTGLNPTGQEMKMIEWTGILSNEKIGLKQASPAAILQNLLEQKWKLREDDKDMIVMQHRFDYQMHGKKIAHYSSLVVKGENSINTAMAKSVGLPVAISALMILNGKIQLKGVQIPVHKSIYGPVLEELKSYGIVFNDKVNESV